MKVVASSPNIPGTTLIYETRLKNGLYKLHAENTFKDSFFTICVYYDYDSTSPKPWDGKSVLRWQSGEVIDID